MTDIIFKEVCYLIIAVKLAVEFSKSVYAKKWEFKKVNTFYNVKKAARVRNHQPLNQFFKADFECNLIKIWYL